MDGERKFGTLASYACWGDLSGAPDPDHPLPFSDVVCMPLSSGGIGGMHHVTMHPRGPSFLFMNTRTSMHGSIFPTDRVAAEAQLPRHVTTVRLIHYPLSEVDKMHSAATEGGSTALAALAAALGKQASSQRLADRLRIAMQKRGL